MNKLFLQSQGQSADLTYLTFKAEFERGIQYVQDQAAAYLWDRLGHWTQDVDDWEEEERCFRTAYDLAGRHYGYCLGTALNFLGRLENAVITAVKKQFLQTIREQKLITNTSIDQYRSALARIEHFPEQGPAIIACIITRIDLSPDQIKITLDCTKLATVAGLAENSLSHKTLTLTFPFNLKKRGIEQKLVIGDRITGVQTIHGEKICYSKIEISL